MKDSKYFAYRDHMPAVAREDVRATMEKDIGYGGSWKKRGGASAYMMLARKWDRIEEIVEQPTVHHPIDQCDVFSWIKRGMGTVEGALEQIRDLRRYLLLVECEMIARGVVPAPGLTLPPLPQLTVTVPGIKSTECPGSPFGEHVVSNAMNTGDQGTCIYCGTVDADQQEVGDLVNDRQAEMPAAEVPDRSRPDTQG